MKYSFVFLISIFMIHTNNAQDTTKVDLPYYQIPDAPADFTANYVVARMVDGLGYRYYWATEGLTKEDLAYTPGNFGKNTADVLSHLYGLSKMILNGVLVQPNVRPAEEGNLTWEETRKKTLENFKQASDLLYAAKIDAMNDYKIIFQRGETTSEFPFWNMINGPIADAIYHTGQVVSYRRSAGNPIDSKVNVFMGKNRKK